MTTPCPEHLHHEGQDLPLLSEPLALYLRLADIASPLVPTPTMPARGYIGHWEIARQRLYLMALQGEHADGRPGNLESLFPGFPQRVFAHWYTGILRIPKGRLVESARPDEPCSHERIVLLRLASGVVRDTWVQINHAPEAVPL